MKKLIFNIMLLTLLVTPNIINAAGDEAKIGNTNYATLSEAVQHAANGEEIVLLKNVEITGQSLKIDNDLTINLNGYNITSSMNAHVISIEKGNVTITGTGMIETTTELKSAIVVKGSNNPSDTNYTTVKIDKNVTLKGWAGLIVTPYISGTQPYAYGVTIDFYGKIEQKKGTNYSGYALYVNGQIQHENNAPVFNLYNTANINAEGMGAYFGGYAVVNIKGASIIGVDNGISAKAGVITVEEGSVIKATGDDLTPTITYGDGINASGAAIQLESNIGYAGKIKLNIKGGQITSEKGYAIYEYLDSADGNTAVEDIKISGGVISSAEGKDIFLVSDNFVETKKDFITGGTFSSDPSEFVNPNYVTKDSNGNFVIGSPVVDNKQPTTNNENVKNPSTSDNLLTSIVMVIISLMGIVTCSIIYRKRYN